VELPGHPWLAAIQWHPEMTAGRDPVQQGIFDAFVEAARNALSQRHEGAKNHEG
jgi:putative glutamine amidotransferase